MPVDFARKQVSESFFTLLAMALDSIGNTTEAADVPSMGQQMLETIPQATVCQLLLSFSVSEAPENTKFEYFDGQVAEVAGLVFTRSMDLRLRWNGLTG